MTDGRDTSPQELERPPSGSSLSEYSNERPAVLIVDSRDGLSSRIDSAIDVQSVADGQAALAALCDEIDCLLVTDRLETDVIDLVARIRHRDSAVPIGLVAFDGSEALAGRATSAGVSEYIPVGPDSQVDLSARLDSLLGTHRERLGSDDLDGIRAVVEHAADAIVITDTDGVIEYVNPAFERVTGYDRAEAIGRNPRILKSGEQGEPYYEQMWETILDGEIWEETIVNETRSGERYIAHQTVAPVAGADGTIERFVGIQRDITRRQQLEEQVERSEVTLSRLYDITANSEDDLETKIETVLEMAMRNLDYQIGYFTRIEDGEQEILAAVGDHDTIEVGKTDPLERTYCRKTIDSDEPVIIGDAKDEGWEGDPAVEEFGLRCYAGARVLVDDEPYGTLCFGGNEPTDRLIVGAHRSTVRTLANWVGYEIEREQYSRKLEQQNERLERFASAVSHDLRNPLSIAQGYVSLARNGDAGPEALESVAEAHRRMEEIIDDTLTLAREGELVEEPTTVSLPSLATDCWRHVDTRDATLEVTGEVSLRADPDKLRHVFENLFRNAVEHGSTSPPSQAQEDAGSKASEPSVADAPEDAVEHGSTSPPSQAQEDAGSKASEPSVADAPEDAVEHGSSDLTIRVGPLDEGFYVEDDGSGIDDEVKDEVFEFGYSTDGGSGFGLAIVETIVRAHDWSVRVTDSDAGGARFEFETDNSTERCLIC